MNPVAATRTRQRIFVSYRRADSEAVVGRLVADLQPAFPDNQVFQDWTSIAPGEDFVVALERELGNCAAALVVIGPRWLSARDASGRRRLDDPDDWVCREIAQCLNRDGVRVFPLLVDGAQMPETAELPEAIRGLARRQAYPIVNRHWEKDVAALLAMLSGLPELRPSRKQVNGTVPAKEVRMAAEGSPRTSQDREGPDADRSLNAGKAWLIVAGIVVAAGIGLLVASPDRDGASSRTKLAQMPEASAVTTTAAEQAQHETAERISLQKFVSQKPKVKYEPGDSFRDCVGCPEMIVVPAGSVLMGLLDGDRRLFKEDDPQLPVQIATQFAIGKYESTYSEWDACVAANACRFSPEDLWGRGRQPVTGISWRDIEEYLKWLSERSGQGYRLPSQVEWEYAARGNDNEFFPLDDKYSGYSGGTDAQNGAWMDGKTFRVGTSTPDANGFGLYDMVGNAAEWTADCWGENVPQFVARNSSDQKTVDCSFGVIRGGPWHVLPSQALMLNSFKGEVGARYKRVGFRVARKIE